MEGIDSLAGWSDRRSRLGLNRTKGRTKMLSGERMIVREGARYWWAFLVSGIVWLLIAWLVLRLNTPSIATVGVLLGVVFLLSGINEVGLASVVPGGWKVWHWILAVIFFLGGVVRLCPAGQHLLRPGLGAGADPGLLRRLRDHPGGSPPGGEPLLGAESDPWDPAGAVGVLGVGLGPGVALAQRTYLILFWGGFVALFRGFSQIFLAFSARPAGQEAAAALGDTSPG